MGTSKSPQKGGRASGRAGGQGGYFYFLVGAAAVRTQFFFCWLSSRLHIRFSACSWRALLHLHSHFIAFLMCHAHSGSVT